MVRNILKKSQLSNLRDPWFVWGQLGLGLALRGFQGFDSNSVSVNILRTVLLRLLRQSIMLLCFFVILYFVFTLMRANIKNTGLLIVSLMPFAQCFVITVLFISDCYVIL